MPKNTLAGFARARDVLPDMGRALRGGEMFSKLTPNGVSISASLRTWLGDYVDVLVSADRRQIALVDGDEYEIGKYGNTWMLKRSTLLSRQLEASGWDKTMRNYAENVDGAVVITNAAQERSDEQPSIEEEPVRRQTGRRAKRDDDKPERARRAA